MSDNLLNQKRIIQKEISKKVKEHREKAKMSQKELAKRLGFSQSKISKFENEIAVLKRFPDQNPNPVLKISASGILLYSNPASSEIIETWSVQQGELVPEDIRDLINGLIKTNKDPAPELSTGEKTFILNMVYVPEFDFINIYATDITAAKLVTKFPEQNPNPVLKVSIDGKLIFANKASNEIISCWNSVLVSIYQKKCWVI